MGRFVDVGKGDRDRTADRQKYLENMERLFGRESKAKGGRYKQDPETGKFISAYDWHKKYGKKVQRTHFVRGDIDPYESPVTGEIIGSRRQQQYDLESTGNRLYEGRQAEQKEANRITEAKWEKLDKTLETSMLEVQNDLKYQNIQKEDRIKSSWLLGED